MWCVDHTNLGRDALAIGPVQRDLAGSTPRLMIEHVLLAVLSARLEMFK